MEVEWEPHRWNTIFYEVTMQLENHLVRGAWKETAYKVMAPVSDNDLNKEVV